MLFACRDDADGFGRTTRLGRTLSARRKRRKRRNVSGRKCQSFVEGIRLFSDATLHREARLAHPLNPARTTPGTLAHAIRTCDSTRTNPYRTASSNNPHNNPLGRSWGGWDGAALRIVRIISSASREIGRKALLVTCHHNDSRNPSRNPSRSLGICAAAAPVGSSTSMRTSPARGSTRPSLLVASTRPMWPIRFAAS